MIHVILKCRIIIETITNVAQISNNN